MPHIISYRGRVTVDDINFDGTGYFKFALVNAAGDLTYWSNDGTGESSHLSPCAAAENLAGSDHLAVPSGGIILSDGDDPVLESAGYVKIGKTVLNDRWVKGSGMIYNLVGRDGFTAVRSVSGGVVNDGIDRVDPGGICKPATDSWAMTTLGKTPSPRKKHSCVWTGENMLIFEGDTGSDSRLNAEIWSYKH